MRRKQTNAEASVHTINKKKIPLLAILSFLGTINACRNAVQETLSPTTSEPQNETQLPVTPETPNVRTAQLIADIEGQFPQFRQLVERRLAEMDRRGLPHVDRESLLAPFEQVTANQQNRFRNVEQVAKDGLNIADTESHLPNHQFFYGLLQSRMVSSGVVFASYDPMTDRVGLPESFDAHETMDLIAFYHEMWHEIRRARSAEILSRRRYMIRRLVQINPLMRARLHVVTCVDVEDEANAYFMQIELVNVLSGGQLRQSRGDIDVAQLEQTIGITQPSRRGMLTNTLYFARALYNANTPIPETATPVMHYPTSYIYAITAAHRANNILVYRILPDGSIQEIVTAPIRAANQE